MKTRVKEYGGRCSGTIETVELPLVKVVRASNKKEQKAEQLLNRSVATLSEGKCSY